MSLFFTVYRKVVSPVLHAVGMGGGMGGCKYQPTCSEYAEVAVARYGAAKGAWMAARRLARCHPFSKGGFDPVP